MVDGRVVELDFDAAGTLVTFFSETFHDSDIVPDHIPVMQMDW
jgi:hypothetical protein